MANLRSGASTLIEANISAEIDSLRKDLIGLRRDFHRHPELSFHETRTAATVTERLRALGLAVTTGVAETGVVGVYGDPAAPAVLVRADMDALPITEANEVDYVSQNPGVMHACGHDGHTAMLLAAATVLVNGPPPPGACYKFVFQPAEEGGGGARAMIEAGVLTAPRVAVALALHVWNDLPVGTLGVRPGPVLAAAKHFRAVLTGKGGHGAMPHQTHDPVPPAAELILAWQTVVARTVNPLEPAVLTVGSIHAGTAGNVIPNSVTLAGTLRAFSPTVQETIIQRMESILKGIALAHDLETEFVFTTGYPPTINNRAVAESVRAAAVPLVGADNVVEQPQVMGAEDMAFFLERVPGCFVAVGSRNETKGFTAPHHNARFDFDEEALVIGAELLVRAAKRLANQVAAGEPFAEE